MWLHKIGFLLFAASLLFGFSNANDFICGCYAKKRFLKRLWVHIHKSLKTMFVVKNTFFVSLSSRQNLIFTKFPEKFLRSFLTNFQMGHARPLLRSIVFFKKNGPSSASFSFNFVFSNKHYNFYNKYMWINVMTIQYTALGFEPTTFGTRVSSHNH